MKIEIPSGNWHIALADAIEASKEGDIIVVETTAQVELGQSAKDDMCPEKNITFEIKKADE